MKTAKPSVAIQSAQSAGYSDWLAADEAALDYIATRIAPKFGVSAEVIANDRGSKSFGRRHERQIMRSSRNG